MPPSILAARCRRLLNQCIQRNFIVTEGGRWQSVTRGSIRLMERVQAPLAPLVAFTQAVPKQLCEKWTVGFVAEAMDTEGNGSSSSILSRFQDVIYIILSHLSMKDLHQAARVNVTWSRVVQNIKRNRVQIGWCYYNELEPDGVDIQIGQAIGNLASEPHYALIFTSRDIHNRLLSVPPRFCQSARSLPRAVKQEYCKISFSTYLGKLLPASCHIAYTRTLGTIGTCYPSNQIVALGSCHYYNTASASCVFLPKLSDVNIYPFMLRGKLSDVLAYVDTLNSTDKDSDRAASRNVDDDRITKKESSDPHDKCPKLILLFLTGLGDILHNIFDCKNLVIAGGSVDSMTFDGTKSKNQDEYGLSGLGIAFCGGIDLHVASVVLNRNISNEELVERKLLHLKAAHLPRSRSLAFMFSSSSRLKNFYGRQENVESKAFRKLFPNTPLVGFLTAYQIGHDFLTDFADMQNMLAADGMKKMAADDNTAEHCHTGVTVFVIISFP